MAVQAGVIETQLTADVRSFTSGMASAQKAFQQTASTIRQGSPAVAASLGSIKDATDAISNSVGKMQSMFKRGMAAIGAGFILPSVFSKANSAIIGFNQQLDESTIAMETFTGSKSAAQDLLKTLQEFAATTPFNFEDLLGTTQQMMAMGVQAKDLIPRLTAIGDAAAALGGSPEILQRVQRALGQIQAKGRVQAEELMQLAEAGIPAYEYIATLTGGDIPAALDLMKKGQIDAASAITALLDGMAGDFSGMMQKQSQTMMGALSTVQDYAQMTIARLGRPIFEAVRGIMLKVAAFFADPKVVKAGELFANNFAKFLKNVGAIAGKLVKSIGPVLMDIGKTAYEFGRALMRGVDGVKPIVVALVGVVIGLAKAFQTVANVLRPVLSFLAEHKTLATVLVGLIAAMALKNKLFGQTTEGVAKAGSKLVESFKSTIASIKDTIAYQQRLGEFQGKTLTGFQAFGAGVRASMMAAKAAVKSFMASVLPLLAISVGISLITSAFSSHNEAVQKAKERYDAFASSLRNATTALLENQDALKSGETGINTLRDSILATGDNSEKLVQAFGALGVAADLPTIVRLKDDFVGTARAMMKTRAIAVGVSTDLAEAMSVAVAHTLAGTEGTEEYISALETLRLGANRLTQEQKDMVSNMVTGFQTLQEEVLSVDFNKLVTEQAHFMLGSGQVTQAMIDEAQAMTDLAVEAGNLGPAAEAVTFNQNLLKLATDQARLSLLGQAAATGTMLSQAKTAIDILRALAMASEDGTVAFEDFAYAVYGTKYNLIQWKRTITGIRSDFGNLINSLGEGTKSIDTLELAVFDLSDSFLGLIQEGEYWGRSQDEINGQITVMAKNFIDAGMKAGYTRDEIVALIDQLGILDKIDPRIDIALGMDTEAIKKQIDSITQALEVAIQRSPEAAAALQQSLAFWQGMQDAFGKTPTYSGGGGGGGGGMSAIDQWVADLVNYANGLFSSEFAEYLATSGADAVMAEWTSLLDSVVALGLDQYPEVMAALNQLESKFKDLAEQAAIRDEIVGLLDEAKAKLADLKTAYRDLRYEAGSLDLGIEGGLVPKKTTLDKAREAYAVLDQMIADRNQLLADAQNYQMGVASSMMPTLQATGSPLGSTSKTLSQAREFLANVKALRERGFTPDIIAEVVGAGMINGNKIAGKLLSMSGTEMQQLISMRNEIAQIGMQTGAIAADVVFGADLAGADAAINKQRALVKSLYETALGKAEQKIADQKVLIDTLNDALATTNKRIAKLTTAIQNGLYNVLFEFLAGFEGAIEGLDKPGSWQGVLDAVNYYMGTGSSGQVTVNVSGSVLSEADLIEAIRLGLIKAQKNGKTLVVV